MPTVTIRMTALCAGNNHATIELTKDGQARNVPMGIAEVRAAPTADDMEVFARLAIRMCSEGKTLVQLRNALNTGFTVTI